jgi:DegV family protein with EDD domain
MAATRIRIVTDTTSALPMDYARAHHIEVVPQVINFGTESYLEGVTLEYSEFIRRLKASAQLPKTAAPRVGDMIEAYRRQLEDATTILSIHPSSEVSGTVRSALTAKSDAFPNADIRVMDTRLIGGNLASMVIAATEWAEHGIDADQIMTRLQEMIPRGRIYFLVATLEYLQKGGRIGGASALIGTALQIKPILELRDGRVEVLEKVRTYHHALMRMRELVKEQCPHLPEAHLCVMYAEDRVGAERLAQELKCEFEMREVPIYLTSASITTHAGPSALSIGFFS